MLHNAFMSQFESSPLTSSTYSLGYCGYKEPSTSMSKPPHHGLNYHGPYQYIPTAPPCFNVQPYKAQASTTDFMVSQSSDLNTPVLHLDSPSSWCRSRNQEFSPVIPANNSPVRADSGVSTRASPTICTPKSRSRQPVNCPVECQGLAFESQFFEDILWPPAVNHLPTEADSTTGSSTVMMSRRLPPNICSKRNRPKRTKSRKQCAFCDKSFATNCTLNHHIDAIHGGNKERLTCKECSKVFTMPSSLIRHEQIHRNEKRYECATCGRRFNDPSTYNKHLITHTGERPYKCTLCKKSFTQNGNLRRHMRQVHKSTIMQMYTY